MNLDLKQIILAISIGLSALIIYGIYYMIRKTNAKIRAELARGEAEHRNSFMNAQKVAFLIHSRRMEWSGPMSQDYTRTASLEKDHLLCDYMAFKEDGLAAVVGIRNQRSMVVLTHNLQSELLAKRVAVVLASNFGLKTIVHSRQSDSKSQKAPT